MGLLEDLAAAVSNLDDEVKHWMGVALTSGRHKLGATRWETELARCPIAAAAAEAGIWHEQGIDAAHTAWSQGEGPNLAIEEFAACFDLACEDHGLPTALSIVREGVGAASIAEASKS
jgi:hypothetical protein